MDYPRKIQDILEEEGIEIGDPIAVERGAKKYEGILMPRTQGGDPACLILKLGSGYNLGVKFSEDLELEKLEKREEEKAGKADVSEMVEISAIEEPEEKPEISILAAGGTIASRIDYRTGAVKPSIREEELVGFTPEISGLAEIEGRQLFQALSENLTPEHWKRIAEAVAEEIKKGKDGVVIMHGTDTMAWTAAALSFMLENLPVPVVLVGSQRSSDRGSSDAHQNLTCAVRTAGSDLAEVMVCMHGESADTYCYLHPGTKVRKMHSSRRDAFRTVNAKPLAKVYWNTLEIEPLSSDYRKKDRRRKLKLKPDFEEDVAFIKSYPGLKAEQLEKQLDGAQGAVFEGTGLGHLPLEKENFKETLEDWIQGGGLAFMTSQCLYGRVNMNVYETGVDLQELGVKGNLNDMLPEVAWIKLSWLLGNYPKEKVEELMGENLRGEISERTTQDDFYPQFENRGFQS